VHPEKSVVNGMPPSSRRTVKGLFREPVERARAAEVLRVFVRGVRVVGGVRRHRDVLRRDPPA
jgi:hypothetical protein